MGSTLAALSAGKAADAKETAAMTPQTTKSVSGSESETPNNCVRAERASRMDSGKPMAIPIRILHRQAS